MSPGSTPTAPCAEVEAIDIDGRGNDDLIDLSAITRADFPQVRGIGISAETPFDEPSADVIRGSQLDDYVDADKFDDVFGNGGNDLLVGGHDVDGGPGDDVISGSLRVQGAVTGGAGDDRMRDLFGASLIDGGPGDDSLDLDLATWVGLQPFTVVATAVELVEMSDNRTLSYPMTGVEHLYLHLAGGGQTVDASAFPGDLFVSAGSGNDTLIGTAHADLLDGGTGDDVIDARDGIADVVRCGAGDDTATLDAVDQVSGCEHRAYPRNQTSAIAGPSTVQRPGTARFTFSSPTPGSTFQCRIDSRAWAPCVSPRSVNTKYLAPGWHKISVRAVNLVGQVDLTPSTRSFRVAP